MIKLAITLTLVGATQLAHAAEWELYSRGSDMSVFVATDRIVRNGDYVETWQKFIYDKPQRTGKKPYNYSIDQITVYCNPAGYALRLHSITYYTKGGNSVDSISGDGPWENIVPDSIAEGVVTRVCRQ
ncbi:surface-adhesin E family protein [Paraburkholderia dipogonis]|uniref:surface-adhesin E family protein n=1 Tax=Paraburkholderia dipogonis TaxID=1211383 RepID=UPI0038B88D4F